MSPVIRPGSVLGHPDLSLYRQFNEPWLLCLERGREPCSPPDAGRAIAFLTTAQTLRHDTYNVSSGRSFTNRELADALQAITPGLRFDPPPGRQAWPGHNPYLDTTRLACDTGFEPVFPTLLRPSPTTSRGALRTPC